MARRQLPQVGQQESLKRNPPNGAGRRRKSRAENSGTSHQVHRRTAIGRATRFVSLLMVLVVIGFGLYALYHLKFDTVFRIILQVILPIAATWYIWRWVVGEDGKAQGASWDFGVVPLKDVIVVGLVVLVASGLLWATLLAALGERSLSHTLALCGQSLVALVTPVAWTRRRYGWPKAALGLRRGTLSPFASAVLGCGIALPYLAVRLAVAPPPPIPHDAHNVALFFVPLTPWGFGATVLTPLAEEVLFRGFVYAYARHVCGRGIGLVLQALLFGAGHFTGDDPSRVVTAFTIGIIVGVLYERAGSLYPSIVCHSTCNYVLYLAATVKR